MANVGFVVATVLTTAGLWLMPGEVGADGADLASVGVITFTLAGTLWLVSLSVRLGVTPSAAAGYVASAGIDEAYATLSRLGGATFSRRSSSSPAGR